MVQQSLAVTENSPASSALWEAFTRAYVALDTSASQKVLASLSGLAEKRVEREVERALKEYLLPGSSWRDLSNYLRLGLASLLLSLPDRSIAEVAKVVGYAHPAALTNAYARAQLPSPSAIRAALAGATADAAMS